MSTGRIGSTDEQPLRGYTVGITADRRWDEQAALLEGQGATVLHGPSIRTLPIGADGPLRTTTEAIIAEPPDALIANTGVGIRSWFGAADSWDLGNALLEVLGHSRIYARGAKAAGALHSCGLTVSGRAPTGRMSEAIDLVLATMSPGERIVIQADGSGEAADADRLRRAGAEVIVVPVYRWKLPEDRRPAVRLAEAVIAGRVHAVTFTAGPALRNWLAIAAEDGIDRQLRESLTAGAVVVGCIGPVCRETAASEGLASEHLVVPSASRLGPLVRTVADRLVGRRLVVEIGATRITLAGTLAAVDGQTVALTDSEARLLATLAGRPNTVFTKEQLLQTVWRNNTGDLHAVEVGIARLRSRLGPHGKAIASVRRRGYTLRS
jgi:uroporphyrinogen-III synthase